MARKPRIQFPGAIYHVITRGDGRQLLFHDDRHYERFTEGLETQVLRCNWQVLAYCWLPNHIHALIKTPEPNLSRGMQHWLSGYANWYAKRNQRTGHLYQGRFKAFQVEDSSYFWTLSRYIHLNPCVGRSPLVAAPQDWSHSSYASYIYRRKRIDWLASQLLLDSWKAEYGGSKPVSAYRRYVERELAAGNPSSPLEEALEDWVIGSEAFLLKLALLAKPSLRSAKVTKRKSQLSAKQILAFVAEQCGLSAEDYCGFRVKAQDREIAALLCRELTTNSLAELSDIFGLGHPDSSANLIRRAKVTLSQSIATKKRYNKMKSKLIKTEKQV